MQSGIFCADIGTSSLKAALVTETGTVLKFMRIPFPHPVQAADWVKSFFDAWQRLPEDCAVEALCISGNGPSLVVLPHEHRTPASHTEAGRPSADIINTIIEAAKNDTVFLWNESPPQGFSVPSSASLFLPRVAAFRAKYPDIFDNAVRLFSGQEYIAYLLTGSAVTSLPDPRYEAAYWSKEELTCFSELLQSDVERLTGLLSPFVIAGTVIGRFCGIPVVAGVPDFIAALIGTGTLTAGTACDRAGSSEGLNICISQPPVCAENTLLLPSVIPELWNLSSVIPSSGAAFSSFLISHGFLGNDYIAAMERITEEPFVAAGVYPETFAGQGRAFVEGLAFQIRHGCDLLEQTSGIRPVYTLSGGQAYNTLWCQMKADITGRVFALPYFADGELIGDAALALYGLGKGRKLASITQQLIRIKWYYEPDSAIAHRYTEKFSQY